MSRPALTGTLYFVHKGEQRTAILTILVLPAAGTWQLIVEFGELVVKSKPLPLPSGSRRREILEAISEIPGPWMGKEIVVDFPTPDGMVNA
jgi:hypothetical protein